MARLTPPIRQPCAPKIDFAARLGLPVAGLRLGRLAEDELSAANAETRRAILAALDTLTAHGAIIGEFRPPERLTDYLARAGRMMSFESYRTLQSCADSDTSRVNAVIRTRIRAGRNILADEYQSILARREDAKSAFAERLESFEAIATPAYSETAIPVAEVDEGGSG
ncbi:hypothetical protein RUR49_19735 [Pseudoxanthobacter sp. M-2]|uniref:hypothetical protein n=1 Tax=Pseudoxanthobacter sp. M-2 TaxID=3078754 RepID=UPI0038FC3C9D